MITPMPKGLEKAVVIASVSGGKDSAAMCLYLGELGITYVPVFADTGWESKETYEYIAGPLTEAIGPIHVVGYAGGMEAVVLKKGMFPSKQRRWCTEELKIKPLQHFQQVIHDKTKKPIISAVGVRASESSARASLPWIDGMILRSKLEVAVWRPILQRSEQWVIDIHRKHGLTPNPLYLRGARRVGCWPCIYSRKSEIRMIADQDPAQIERIRKLEKDASDVARSRGARDIAFFQARKPDTDGRYPCEPIDKVVDWCRTAKGGKEYEEPTDRDADEGCVRWGMCETIAADREGLE